jgi:hypothetical protein
MSKGDAGVARGSVRPDRVSCIVPPAAGGKAGKRPHRWHDDKLLIINNLNAAARDVDP